jgi:hypothetical protein
LEEYCSWPKLFNTPAIPLLGYPKNTLGSITYLLKLGRVLLMVRNIQCTCNNPCKVSQKSFGFYNISFETWKGITLPYQNEEGKQYSHHIVIIS